ncbi:trafficking protein particle complex subunit 2-like protein [Watersipora subatra]|uniref:trafficking protein particle complex subunit 2-like protein n=1 Tax=Watersipora subatra TaxID=2589382 RepID=UPI00355C3483
MAVCVAVIAKDNYPLFVKTVPAEDELKFTYIVHTSLDVVEERLNNTSRAAGDMRELYLGQLYPTEDYKVYGFVTNTKVKFILIVEASNANLRDNEIRGMFRKLHNAYVSMVFNPFYTTSQPISSRSFEKTISTILIED